MPVCLHCGEIAPDGALFCARCGYTVPQGDAAAGGSPRAPGGPTQAVAFPYPPSAPTVPSPPTPPAGAAGSGPAVVALPAGLPPLPPPPNAKLCVRCGTAIAQAAVYCPVCQNPQP